MAKLSLDLPFFANLLQADEKDLEFAIVKRKYNDGAVFMAPCLVIRKVKNYVFSLSEGEFVPLGQRSDSTLSRLKATVVKTEEGIVLRTKQGHSVPYSKKDFRRLYAFRVVNPILYR